MIGVSGIGWINASRCGMVRKGWSAAHEGMSALVAGGGRFADLPKNWGRFDPVSRVTFVVVTLALEDAGWSADAPRDRTGLVATNRDGCLRANEAYFRDYVETGRRLGRGNLFIYTLPSSAVAEAAIHFGFRGPLLYVSEGDAWGAAAMDAAAALIADGQAKAMLVVAADETSGLCCVAGEGGAWALREAWALGREQVGKAL